MAETTGIAWCDSTFNPWIGCTKVSPGCDSCYAEALDKRHRWKGATHWGPGVPRLRTSPSNWELPLRWNRKAEASGKRHLVFCASLADVFDNEVDPTWRHDLFRLIRSTPNLTWLLLTKRIGNVTRMIPAGAPWENVWIGASVVNQEEADRDIPKLLATPAAKRFVSYEPALGPVDFTAIPRINHEHPHPAHYDMSDLDWVIVGGESSQGGALARPFDIAWARSTVAQCKVAGVACFVKQLGSCPFLTTEEQEFGGGVHFEAGRDDLRLKDRAGANPAEWPVDLQIQEFPK